MKSSLIPLSELLVQINIYFDTNPKFDKSNAIHITVPNLNYVSGERGYGDLIDVFAGSRYIRFKFRDPELMIEHDISFLPWCDGFNYQIWNDGLYDNIDWSTSQAIESSYVRTEEEYFQYSTLHDFKGIEFETLLEVVKLQERMYNYFDITPITDD